MPQNPYPTLPTLTGSFKTIVGPFYYGVNSYSGGIVGAGFFNFDGTTRTYSGAASPGTGAWPAPYSGSVLSIMMYNAAALASARTDIWWYKNGSQFINVNGAPNAPTQIAIANVSTGSYLFNPNDIIYFGTGFSAASIRCRTHMWMVVKMTTSGT